MFPPLCRTTKPFACLTEGCGKSYCDARSLRRHKENHHSGDKDATNGSDTNNLVASGVTVASTPTLTVSTVAVPVQPKEIAALSSGLTATLVENKNSDGTSPVLSNDNQSLRGDLPATKVTAKGLSPQQFQLIERLFKNSKNLTSTTVASTVACSNDSPTSKSATTSISLNPSQRASSEERKSDCPRASPQSQGMNLMKAYELSAILI